MDEPVVEFIPWFVRRDEVFALEVSDIQHEFIDSTVAEFLADDEDHPTFRSFAVCAGPVVVGLACYGQEVDHEPGQWWIPLVVIDHRYQGRGYGRATMHAIIARIRAEAPAAYAIGLSCKPANLVAMRLYRDLGFEPAGPNPRGGVDMWLTLSHLT